MQNQEPTQTCRGKTNPKHTCVTQHWCESLCLHEGADVLRRIRGRSRASLSFHQATRTSLRNRGAVGAFEWVPFLVEKPCAASLSIYRYICINNICLYTMSAPGASETKHAESGSWLSPTLVASVEARNRTRLHEILFVLAIFLMLRCALLANVMHTTFSGASSSAIHFRLC